MKSRKTVGSFLLCGALVLTLGACSGAPANGEEDGPSSGAPAATDNGSEAGGVRIGASLLTQSHPFQVAVKEAMEAEAAAEGAELTISIADQDLNKQVAQVEDFINKQVDVIVLSPVDSDGVTGAVKKAQEAGIPVVTVDIPANNVEADSHVATDNYTGGLIAAEALAQAIDAKGEVGVITYPEVQSVRDRIDGFKKLMEQYPEISIVKETPGRDRGEAKAAAEDMITAVPGIAGIFGFGDDMALAATQAVGDAGSQAVVVGFDGMDEAKKAVDSDNSFWAVVVQYPDEMGKVAIENAVGLAAGKDVPKETPITPGLYVQGHGDVPVSVDGDKVTIDVK